MLDECRLLPTMEILSSIWQMVKKIFSIVPQMLRKQRMNVFRNVVEKQDYDARDKFATGCPLESNRPPVRRSNEQPSRFERTLGTLFSCEAHS